MLERNTLEKEERERKGRGREGGERGGGEKTKDIFDPNDAYCFPPVLYTLLTNMSPIQVTIMVLIQSTRVFKRLPISPVLGPRACQPTAPDADP
jgi:hypothetical protein